ncbi:LCCL domain containing protein [Colletotrichum truncatum]|uniref:LCCL domain containing protein n=1 Tax=Colletotrichum truncatum TaxID=5467 RepID=A0ACC3Z8V5_COLTU|nr:LCCL domain containing protein [Colletotrichum truncatum]KAF6780953.1 LCCL domain containing protein [Colletotrichum truncatum]
MGIAGDGGRQGPRHPVPFTDDPGTDALPPRRGSVDEEAQLLAAEEFELEPRNSSGSSSNSSILEQKFPATKKRHCLAGPQPPRTHTIRPVLPWVQEAPPRLLDRLAPTPRRKACVVAVFLALWVIAFSIPLASSRAIKDSSGKDVLSLDCGDTLWQFKNECGLDGADCRPFTNSSFSFKCPANCMAHKLLNPHAVGPKEIVYKQLVVGDGIYRGDSMICAAAIHAGIVSDLSGGCGRVHRIGQHERFNSSMKNGVETVSFDSYFPLSFNLSADSSLQCGKRDPRQVLLPTSLFFSTIFSIFTTSPAWQFFVSFLGIFAHVSFGSDPPTASRHVASVLPDRISMFTGRLLPAAFCAVVMYWTCVKRTLTGLKAQFEKTALWLGGFWFGALSNYTFSWMPIQRLTAHDIEHQPGAKPALALILTILTFVMAKQVYYFWLEGRLPRFIALYTLFLVGIIIGLSIPGVDLRIHHYIMTFLLIPGTSMQTRSSLFYQGMVLGLFANGIARWGFDSILQTPDALREDGPYNSLLPQLAEPVISKMSFEPSISFSWILPPNAAEFDAISALVNDVERYRYYFADGDAQNQFIWMRKAKMALPEYFRFAYMKDGITLDYTPAGTWLANGTWLMPPQ